MAVCPVTALRSPSDVGFGPGLTAIDRCQVGLLREMNYRPQSSWLGAVSCRL